MGEDIMVLKDGCNGVCGIYEYVVIGFMIVGVVYLFEVIDVQYDDGYWCGGLFGLVDFMCVVFKENVVVGYIGQWVCRGKYFCVFFFCLQFCCLDLYLFF